jgi:hypothetical protein
MRFLGGIFLLTVCLIEIFLSGSLQFYVLILVIFSISVISEVLIKKYDNLFSIMFGFLLLISASLWILFEQTSLDVIFFLIVAIIFIILGILRILGYIPEKWFSRGK